MTQPDLQKRLDEILAPFNRSDQPGLIVGVAVRGKAIYRRGFGLASVELGVANRPSTRMRIGSTSKHFGAIAALLLAEEGRLDIDAPVRKIIPELPKGNGDVTLRHFMTHTSGLRDFLDLSFLSEGMTVKPADYPQRAQLAQDKTNFEPGTKAVYNNGGYHLLSVAVERAAGMPFEEFVASRVFEPVGMKDTFWAPSDLDAHSGMATLYIPGANGGWRKGLFPNEGVRAEGGMVSTVDDLLRWLKHMRSAAKLVGSAASWKQMMTTSTLSTGIKVPYALGLMLGTYRGLDIVHHGGSVIGGGCQMLTVPSRELDIAILTNGAPVNPGDLAEKLIDCVLHDEELPPAPAKASADAFRALVGKTYRSTTSGFVVNFLEAEGSIAGAVFNNFPIPLMDDSGDLRLPFEKVVTGPFVFETAALKAGEAAPDKLVMRDAGTPD
jgi:D-aminopeptidase